MRFSSGSRLIGLERGRARSPRPGDGRVALNLSARLLCAANYAPAQPLTAADCGGRGQLLIRCTRPTRSRGVNERRCSAPVFAPMRVRRKTRRVGGQLARSLARSRLIDVTIDRGERGRALGSEARPEELVARVRWLIVWRRASRTIVGQLSRRADFCGPSVAPVCARLGSRDPGPFQCIRPTRPSRSAASARAAAEQTCRLQAPR